jgi:hypothetical protein
VRIFCEIVGNTELVVMGKAEPLPRMNTDQTKTNPSSRHGTGENTGLRRRQRTRILAAGKAPQRKRFALSFTPPLRGGARIMPRLRRWFPGGDFGR